MKKMNNKGFMMAEVVVVSSIVLVFLAGLYASYNKIYTSYRNLINYYDITTLYKLGYYRDTLINNISDSSKTNINDILSMVNDKAGNNTSTFYIVQNAVSVSPDDKEKVFLIRNGKKNLTNNFADSSHQVCSITNKTSLTCDSKKLAIGNVTFKEYLNFLSTSADLSETNYVMVMEKCADANNCKYAYLEVKDGKE